MDPKYETHDNEMIARILHLPSEKNKLLLEHDIQSIRVHRAMYEIDNRSVCDIFDQIFKDTDLYPYVKQHKSKRSSREAFYAIHSR